MKQSASPMIIQGGMGVGVSSWQLAKAVAEQGQMGVVSGTALDVVVARRLQQGDPDGHVRRALSEFPLRDMAERVEQTYFVPGGVPAGAPLRQVPMLGLDSPQRRLELVVVANFVEVFLAKEGHDGLVGINYLEKIQLPTLPSLFGAMMARVDYVLMGAGIPVSIPGVIDALCAGRTAELPLHVAGGESPAVAKVQFDPRDVTGDRLPWMLRPQFLPIISSASLGTMLLRKSNGRVDGFVVEGPTAGGHNAPPRGALRLDEHGEPIYGPRDVVDLEALRQLGVPFWLAGSYGSPQRLAEALQAGAAGVQVGTAFAFCEESGLTADIKRQVLRGLGNAAWKVRTDPVASPAGFPFKVLQLPGTLAADDVYAERRRVCDLGFLRQAYPTDDGGLGWRCPPEPEAAYVAKGGTAEEAAGRKCLCNALMANVGLGQLRHGEPEPCLVTCGDDVESLREFLPAEGADRYTAADVIRRLLEGAKAAPSLAPAAQVATS
jgi:nitronate monooxygenase